MGGSCLVVGLHQGGSATIETQLVYCYPDLYHFTNFGSTFCDTSGFLVSAAHRSRKSSNISTGKTTNCWNCLEGTDIASHTIKSALIVIIEVHPVLVDKEGL